MERWGLREHCVSFGEELCFLIDVAIGFSSILFFSFPFQRWVWVQGGGAAWRGEPKAPQSWGEVTDAAP